MDNDYIPAIAAAMKRQGFSTFLIAALTVLGAALFGSAPALAAPTNITPSLIAETNHPASGGVVSLAIVMRPKPGWHGYWKTPGDAGFSNEFSWDLPRSVSVSELRYPVPEKLILTGLMNHVFLGEYALLTQLRLPSGLAAGTPLPLRIKARWLACTDRICVPEDAEFGTELIIGDGKIELDQQKHFDVWRQKLARPLGTEARFDATGDTFRLSIPIPSSIDTSNAWFFSETEKAISYHYPQKVVRDGDHLIIETARAEYGFQSPAKMIGVLALRSGAGFEVSAKPGPVSPVSDHGLASFWLALGGAILGGLLLNIMPCVFPIISLKALSLARSGGDPKDAKREAWAYASGVIITCLALGGLLLALRAGGHAVGWAFQLQDPRVILFLLLLSATITFNFAGLFGLRGFAGGDSLASSGGMAGSFWTGALAAFVATPCTGPFMAAALGAALVLPLASALAIFAGLGVGLALPFLLIAYSPSLRARMPRPGPWMVRFQRWLALPMALTTLALMWLLGRQLGQSGLFLGVALTVLLGALLALLGRKFTAGIGLASLLAVQIAIVAAAAPFIASLSAAETRNGQKTATDFTEARLARLRAQGKPVFLYFTADWCVSCKVNEQVAIDRTEIRQHFKERGIVTLIGDWTNGDPVISRFLEQHGRTGVPLYLYYSSGNAEPVELPQILTPARLLAL